MFVETDATARAVTHKEVFEVFICGGLAHANKQKKEQFDRWQGEIIFPALDK
jgi:hypothetical protein